MTTNSSNNILQLNEVIVAIVPWPEHGHLNQLFHVASFISSHNIPVHFISLTDRNHDLKLRVQNGLKSSQDIHFNDLLVPSMTEKAKTQDEWADEYLFLEFLEKLNEPIYKTCLELSTNTKKLVIIYDSLMTSNIGDVYSIPNVESYAFHAISAFTMYSTHQQILQIVDEDHDKVVCQVDEFPRVENCFGPDLVDSVKKGRECDHSSGEFMNSCRELESKYLDLLANVKNKPLWALGPFHMLLESVDLLNSSNKTRHECLEFLDKQDVNSVIFVSFGTTTTFSQEQVNELALGLEHSNHKFIWVLREADKKMDMEKPEGKDGKFKLPDGFEERVEGRGMVVRSWVPQLEILGHLSTGGFLSHCGWNSCMESISNGVPIAAWPIHVDQPYNAVFITNVLKIGISVRSWARREELVTAAAVEKAVKTLMGTPEGEEMRLRAFELCNKIKSSLSHGGTAHKERESFISYITK